MPRPAPITLSRPDTAAGSRPAQDLSTGFWTSFALHLPELSAPATIPLGALVRVVDRRLETGDVRGFHTFAIAEEFVSCRIVGADEVDRAVRLDRIFHAETPQVGVEQHASEPVVQDVLRRAVSRRKDSRLRIARLVGADPSHRMKRLPPLVIESLGLRYSHSRSVRTANGIVERRIFHGAYITIKGRYEQMSVMENDQQTPALIGVLILEALDFVVDPKSEALSPNPASEGKWMADLYYVDYWSV